MASSICLSSNLLRYISVVFISWCPNAWEIRAILTPVFFKMLANIPKLTYFGFLSFVTRSIKGDFPLESTLDL